MENELRIAVKKVPGGSFSTWANEVLAAGQELDVLPPTGRFYTDLHPTHKKQYLAFAAGSGITPVLSLLKTTLAVEPESHFTLVYGNRHRPSILFREELDALKNRYMQRLSIHHILSREEMDIPLYQGRIDAEKCEELCQRLIDPSSMDEIFLCGPESMIFTVRDWLQQKGVAEKKIHFELFHSVGAADAAKTRISTEASGREGLSQVTIRLDGNSHVFDLSQDGPSILEAGLIEGVDLPYACKGGVCCTCRAKLIEGQVEMEINYALEKDELAAGFILTCQAHPRSERIVVDFDSK